MYIKGLIHKKYMIKSFTYLDVYFINYIFSLKYIAHMKIYIIGKVTKGVFLPYYAKGKVNQVLGRQSLVSKSQR